MDHRATDLVALLQTGLPRQASTPDARLSGLELVGVDGNRSPRATRGQEVDDSRSRQAMGGRELDGSRLRQAMPGRGGEGRQLCQATEVGPGGHLLHLARRAVAEAAGGWTRTHFTAALDAWARDVLNRTAVEGSLCRRAVGGGAPGLTSPTVCRVAKGPAGADGVAQ